MSCYGTDSEGTDYKSYSHYYYEYDGNGNITAEYGKNRTLRYKYYYDSLNQLVRVNDAVAQKTYTYVYDTAGNILSKKEYSYTAEDTITTEPNNVINYTYDSVWKDKLTSFGSTAITYDNIGNPLTIGDKSFTWSGRQLETYTQGNTKDRGRFLVFEVGNTLEITKAVDFTDDAIDTIKTLDKSSGFTKSTASAGRKIHAGYKSTPGFNPNYKEFARIKGMRPDYVDFDNNTIFELKPLNPLNLKGGVKQLQRYNNALGGSFTLRLELY